MQHDAKLNSTSTQRLMTTCRCCKSENMFCFLPMGPHAPANMFVRPEDRDAPQPAFLLDAQVCLDCGLVQVTDQIPEGFFEHYLYVPSGAATMHVHFADFARKLEERACGRLIVDIGCNDGLMLAAANANGSRTLGVDPAANIADLARERGVEVEEAYFTVETARRVRGERGPAAVIAASNTFNHIGDLHAFMAAVAELLADDGTFVVEVPWALKILEGNQFDNVYHEHVSELSLLSISKLVQFFDMDVVDVEHLPVHGGSIRVFVRRRNTGDAPSQAVADTLAAEADAQLTEQATWEAFADRIRSIGEELVHMIDDLRAQGLSVAGYGAPAKGNTLLTYFGLGPDRIDFLVDRNPLKQGMLTPNTGIEVLAPAAIASRKPDVLLVLAWNFLDEIVEQQAAFKASGGQLLVPLPEPRLL